MPGDVFYEIGGQVFVWDEQKARRNQVKHGVSFKEAAEAFLDPLAAIKPDPRHSEAEDRRILVGETGRGRLVVVVHVERGGWLRLISARKANQAERKSYEEGS